jgi:hypothetical protein
MNQWNKLTDEDRERAMKSMPDMLEGFLNTWGWLHFAKAIEDICKEKNAAPAPDVQPVAWMNPDEDLSDDAFTWACNKETGDDFTVPLYTHPPAADVQELVEAFSYVIRDLEMRSHLKRGDEKGVVDIGHGAYEKAKAALAKWRDRNE